MELEFFRLAGEGKFVIIEFVMFHMVELVICRRFKSMALEFSRLLYEGIFIMIEFVILLVMFLMIKMIEVVKSTI